MNIVKKGGVVALFGSAFMCGLATLGFANHGMGAEVTAAFVAALAQLGLAVWLYVESLGV